MNYHCISSIEIIVCVYVIQFVSYDPITKQWRRESASVNKSLGKRSAVCMSVCLCMCIYLLVKTACVFLCCGEFGLQLEVVVRLCVCVPLAQ